MELIISLHFEYLRVDRRIILKLILQQPHVKLSTEFNWLIAGPLAKFLRLHKSTEFLDQLSDCKLFKEDSVA